MFRPFLTLATALSVGVASTAIGQEQNKVEIVILPHPELAKPWQDCEKAMARGDIRFTAFRDFNGEVVVGAPAGMEWIPRRFGIKLIVENASGTSHPTLNYRAASLKYCQMYDARLQSTLRSQHRTRESDWMQSGRGKPAK